MLRCETGVVCNASKARRGLFSCASVGITAVGIYPSRDRVFEADGSIASKADGSVDPKADGIGAPEADGSAARVPAAALVEHMAEEGPREPLRWGLR